MNLYENIKSNLKEIKESETIGDLLEEIDSAYSIGEIESIGKRFKNEMDRKTIEDEVNAIEEEYGDVYEIDEDSEEYASILDELKSCISSDFSGEEENLNESEKLNEEEIKELSDPTLKIGDKIIVKKSRHHEPYKATVTGINQRLGLVDYHIEGYGFVEDSTIALPKSKFMKNLSNALSTIDEPEKLKEAEKKYYDEKLYNLSKYYYDKIVPLLISDTELAVNYEDYTGSPEEFDNAVISDIYNDFTQPGLEKIKSDFLSLDYDVNSLEMKDAKEVYNRIKEDFPDFKVENFEKLFKESESFKLNKDADDFKDLVKRDFKLFLLDNYNDEEYKDVTEDDINTYFTGMFYDIFDNDDIETANLAEDIIRREYGFKDKINEAEEKHYEEIDSKSVQDSDGFTTDYTLYKDLDNNRYVCVFGDKEAYKPEDEDFDFISDYEEEAKEWFNEYKGFEDMNESEGTIQKRKLEDCPEDVKTAVYDFLYNNYGPSKINKIEKTLDDIKYEEYGDNNETLGFIYVTVNGKEYKLDIDGNIVKILDESEETNNIIANVTYHDKDGTRDYIAGELSDGRYFLIGQQEQIVVSNENLPKLAKDDFDNYTYDSKEERKFMEVLADEDKTKTIDKDSDLAKIIINASKEYLDDGCYLLSESEEREYYSDAPWFKNKELYNEYKEYVNDLLSNGAIDDPERVKTLSKDDYESLLVDTWMKDREIQKDFEDVKGIVSCGLCDEYVDKDGCRKEMNLGWLCSDCQNSLYSRGEEATYVENLDETEETEEISFDEIEARMANAEDYDDLYAAVGLIADPAIRTGAENMLDICKRDGDDVETAYSVTTTEYIDSYRNEENIIFKESDKLNESEKDVKDQIRFVCKIDNIPSDEDFVDFVYNKHLDGFSGEIMKKLREEYDKSKSKNEAEETQTKTPEPIMVYMNTWKNYNEYGADLESYGIKDGWMTPEKALEFCNKYAEDEPFINDVDNNSGIDLEISEYDNAPSVLEGLVKLNDAMTSGAGNADKDDIGLLWEAWADKKSASTPSIENINEFLDFLENGEYYVHNDITSDYDIGKWYVDNVGYEGISNIENYINTTQMKEDRQEEIDNEYGEDSEDWYEVDDYMIDEDIEQAVQANNTDLFDRYFDYESLGNDIDSDGCWYITDNGSVEIY